MKNIKITENELISLIEKVVNENIGSIPSLSAHGGGFANLGMAKPTDKYKDLYEDDDIETEVDEDQDPSVEKSDSITVTTQPGSDDEDAWMESIVDRLKGKLNEADGKGCSESEGGSGCIKKGSYTDKSGKKYPWHILNNKKGGIWKGCAGKKDCESILDAFHANS
jgi:hypothetical protein|tara:strand:+ start:10646 stop:11143 length:498 start_codon:yes stop_codon:yes gene_type:complete